MKAGIDASKTWFVARTNIKCETKALENLLRAGYDAYLPRYRVEKRNKRSNTWRIIERPLMLRYLFVGQPRHNADWFTLRACEGVETVLGDIGGSYIPIPTAIVEQLFDAEMDMRYDDTRAARIHRKEEARTKRGTGAMRFPAGMPITVLEGPFASFPATVDSVTSRGEISALVEIFGRLTPVTLSPEQLGPRKRRRAA